MGIFSRMNLGRLFTSDTKETYEPEPLNIDELSSFEVSAEPISQDEAAILAELKEEALDVSPNFQEDKLGNQSPESFTMAFTNICDAIKEAPSVNCFVNILHMIPALLPDIDLGFGSVEEKARNFLDKKNGVLNLDQLAPATEQDNTPEVYGENDVPNMPSYKDHAYQEPLPLEAEKKSLGERAGLGLSRFFNKASKTASSIKEKTPGFLSSAWKHACENKGTIAASAAIGITASAVCPFAFAVAPALAAGREIHRTGIRNIDKKRLAKVVGISAATSFAFMGMGDALDVGDWFNGDGDGVANDAIPQSTGSENVLPSNIDSPIDVPADQPLAPALDTPTQLEALLERVDTSAAEAQGYDFSWAERVLDSSNVSQAEIAQAVKDMSFAASFDDPELQRLLLQVGEQVDPTNVQISNDLAFINT